MEQNAEGILLAKGFQDLFYIAALYPAFPFDWSGFLDGRLAFIDVTMNMHHRIERKVPLLQALRALGFLLFMSPNSLRYALVPINKGKYINLESKQILIEEGGDTYAPVQGAFSKLADL